MISRVWFRLRVRGLVAGLFQLRFLLRAAVYGELCMGEPGCYALVGQRSFPVGV